VEYLGIAQCSPSLACLELSRAVEAGPSNWRVMRDSRRSTLPNDVSGRLCPLAFLDGPSNVGWTRHLLVKRSSRAAVAAPTTHAGQAVGRQRAGRGQAVGRLEAAIPALRTGCDAGGQSESQRATPPAALRLRLRLRLHLGTSCLDCRGRGTQASSAGETRCEPRARVRLNRRGHGCGSASTSSRTLRPTQPWA
jgi:hypothetical protein